MSILNLKEANTTIISNDIAKGLISIDDILEIRSLLSDHIGLQGAHHVASLGVLESMMSAKTLGFILCPSLLPWDLRQIAMELTDAPFCQ